MKKHFRSLILLISCCALTACAEEQVAEKAPVDVKSAAAAHTAAAKAATTGQAPAPAKPSTAAKAPAAKPDTGATKPDTGAGKTTVPPVPGAAKAAPTPGPAAAKAAPAPGPAAAKAAPAPGPAGAKTPPAPNAGKAAAEPAKSVKVDDPPPALSVPAGFEYIPRGRRDPFINPIPKPVAGTTADEVAPVIRPDGLPGVLVSEVRLTGIIHSSDQSMNKAMLVVGRSTYFAKKGDSLFDGVIKEIRPNEVVFAMVSASTRKPMNRDTVVRTGASSGTSAGEKK